MYSVRRINRRYHEIYEDGRLEGEQLEYDHKGNLGKQTFRKKGVEISTSSGKAKKEYYDEILSILDDRLDEPLVACRFAARELHLKDIISSFL